MSPYVRGVGVAAATAALVAGFAVYGSAQAQEEPVEQRPGTQQGTLRDAATAADKFVGTAVNDARLSDQAYTDIASSEFSSVTAENAMKWDTTEPSRGSFNFAAGDRLVEFAGANDQQVYGHTLVWHSQLPSWVSNGGFGAEELNQVMVDHITEVAGHYAGQAAYWDVVNEVFNEDGTMRPSVFQNTLGDGWVADAFRAADAADPDAKLCINDYNVEGINAKSDAMYQLVSDMLDQGVPVDCVGLQSHLIVGQVPGDLQENIQRFADLGLEVIITELDIRMTMPSDSGKLEQQGQDYQQVVSACVAVSGCAGVTVWGISDADSWVPGVFPGEGAACPWDENLQPKPAYDGILAGFGAQGVS
jgi:endo-1,4-beta-xylanase